MKQSLAQSRTLSCLCALTERSNVMTPRHSFPLLPGQGKLVLSCPMSGSPALLFLAGFRCLRLDLAQFVNRRSLKPFVVPT